MRQMKCGVVAVAMLCWAASVFLAASGPAEDVKARYADLSAAVAKKDLAKLGALYAADARFAVQTPGGRDQVTGLESVLEMWQKAIVDGAVGFDAVVSEATVKGDVLTEKGTFAMKKKDGSLFLKGTYSAQWRREKGILKLTSHQLVGQ